MYTIDDNREGNRERTAPNMSLTEPVLREIHAP